MFEYFVIIDDLVCIGLGANNYRLTLKPEIN